jgi:hypothetical protein
VTHDQSSAPCREAFGYRDTRILQLEGIVQCVTRLVLLYASALLERATAVHDDGHRPSLRNGRSASGGWRGRLALQTALRLDAESFQGGQATRALQPLLPRDVGVSRPSVARRTRLGWLSRHAGPPPV